VGAGAGELHAAAANEAAATTKTTKVRLVMRPLIRPLPFRWGYGPVHILLSKIYSDEKLISR